MHLWHFNRTLSGAWLPCIQHSEALQLTLPGRLAGRRQDKSGHALVAYPGGEARAPARLGQANCRTCASQVNSNGRPGTAGVRHSSGLAKASYVTRLLKY